jgi:hypothetical protein
MIVGDSLGKLDGGKPVRSRHLIAGQSLPQMHGSGPGFATVRG